MARDELLNEVVRNLEDPLVGLRFTPRLEDHYRRTASERARRSMIGASMIGFMILALFTFDTVFVIDPFSDRPCWGSGSS